MKNLILIIFSLSLILFSCKTSQLTSFNDDVYTNPDDEKKIAIAQAEALKKKQADQLAAQESAMIAQKAKDDANPYYKDPQYNSDDYYDYAYASRMRRFQTPVSGAGYYDNYYTNAYSYNQNPSSYGTSIYSSYNWWNSSGSPYMNNSFGNSNCMNNGMGYGIGYNTGYNMNNSYYNSFGSNNYGYGNCGCNNYGYNNSGYYQPWNMYNNSYMNNPWGYGNGYGYGNSMAGNNSWGYYNSYDVNSNYTYAPREGNTGSNSTRSSYAGMAMPKDLDENRAQFINSMVAKQETTPRFTNTERTISGPATNNPYVGGNGTNTFNSGRVSNGSNPNLIGGSGTTTNANVNTGRHNAFFNNNNATQVESNTGANANSRINQNSGTKLSESNNKIQENSNTFFNRSSGGGGNFGSGGGSISSPRVGGGGSSSRPR